MCGRDGEGWQERNLYSYPSCGEVSRGGNVIMFFRTNQAVPTNQLRVRIRS